MDITIHTYHLTVNFRTSPIHRGRRPHPQHNTRITSDETLVDMTQPSKSPTYLHGECLCKGAVHSHRSPSFSNHPLLNSNIIDGGEGQPDRHQSKFTKNSNNNPALGSGGKETRLIRTQSSKSKLFIPSRRDYSEIELETIYLILGDYRRIRCDNRRTPRDVKAGRQPNSDTEYFRGLEHNTHQAWKVIRTRLACSLFPLTRINATTGHQTKRSRSKSIRSDFFGLMMTNGFMASTFTRGLIDSCGVTRKAPHRIRQR